MCSVFVICAQQIFFDILHFVCRIINNKIIILLYLAEYRLISARFRWISVKYPTLEAISQNTGIIHMIKQLFQTRWTYTDHVKARIHIAHLIREDMFRFYKHTHKACNIIKRETFYSADGVLASRLTLFDAIKPG